MDIDCKRLLIRFIDEKLDGNIQRLKTYCIADLKGVQPYGVCNSSFDCDNTRLACAVYVLLWGGHGNLYEDLTLENLGTGKKYRGDTMNSFHSVLGHYEKNQICRELIQLGLSDDLKEKIDGFFRTYHTIGNFTVLPNAAVGRNTLNTYRGIKFCDYFDLFLIEYDKAVRFGGDSFFVQLVENNPFPKSLGKVAEEMFWEEYFAAGKPRKVFQKHFSCQDIKNLGDDYLTHIEDYIDVSNRIIGSRANKIIDRLESIL